MVNSYSFIIDVIPHFKVLLILVLILVIVLLLLKIVESIKKFKTKTTTVSREEPKISDNSIHLVQELDDIKKSIEELKKSIREKMPGRQEIKPGKEESGIESMRKPEPYPDEELTDIYDVAACIRLYNSAIGDEQKQLFFNRRFKPSIRIDVINADDRSRNKSLEPQFQSSNSGDLFVVEIIGAFPAPFLVFPRFELTISDSNYQAGAFGEVFDCPDFNTQNRYTVHHIVSPAFFSPGQSGSWILEKKGELELTPIKS